MDLRVLPMSMVTTAFTKKWSALMNRGCYIVLVRLDLRFFALDSELTMSLQKWERFKCNQAVSIVTSLSKSTGCII